MECTEIAMADIIRRQMRAVGILQALAPVMDVARDARWGRVSETYGEDPYLVTVMSVAYTRGLLVGINVYLPRFYVLASDRIV